jgi:DNA-binding CsgD family transcriptional regulator
MERESAALESQGPEPWLPRTLWTRALLQETTGAVECAYATLAQAWDLCAGIGVASELAVLAPDLVRLALVADDHHRAKEATEVVTEMASREALAWLDTAALRCRGMLHSDSETLLAAVEASRASHRPLERACALEEAAAVSARDGNNDAPTLLLEAIGIYEDLQALTDIARAEAGLRVLGVQRGRRGTRRRPATGWKSLTNTEHRVVALVAEGLSNRTIGERLFISPRTVQTHLAHVFSKLGLSSRTQLAALVARQPTKN